MEISCEYENAMFNNELLQSMERSTDLTETHSNRVPNSTVENTRNEVSHVYR